MCRILRTSICLLLVRLVLSSSFLRADVVLEWDAMMIDAIRVDNSGPTISSRNLAILHAAIYDAVNSVIRSHQPYLFRLEANQGTSPEAAAVGAAFEVMNELYESFGAVARGNYENWVSNAPHNASTTNGLMLGKRVAQLLLESRAEDGSSTQIPYIFSDAAGQWRRTPPLFRAPVTPHWRYVTTFCLPSVEPFVPGPPPTLDSAEYAVALNEVKALGAAVGSVRTTEQSQIAVFWSDFSYTSMPPGHWHLIAQTISRNLSTSLIDNARLFALISLAQADAAIVCWEAKYRYNLWRPITAIQRAAEDGNPLTIPDVSWNHFLASPPFPAYMSGHSTFSKASAQVLTHFYGTDAISFSATSDSLPGVTRKFESLAACADEVGMSRIYGGIHYSFDNVEGKRTGSAIGDYIYANYLHPNDRLPFARLESVHGGTPVLRVHGHIGASAVLESSVNLVTWKQIAGAIGVPGGWLYRDSSGHGESSRFYRAREE